VDKQSVLQMASKLHKRLPTNGGFRSWTSVIHLQNGYAYLTNGCIAVRWYCPEAVQPETYSTQTGERLKIDYPHDRLRQFFEQMGVAGGYIGTSVATPYECLARAAKAAEALSGLAVPESWQQLAPIELETDASGDLWAVVPRHEIQMRVQVGRNVSSSVPRRAMVEAKYLARVAEVYRQLKATQVTIDLPDGQDPLIFRSAQAEVVLSQMMRR
jgi:hypothetical protein